MRIRFWGVRGSLPSPLLPAQIKSKISAIMERLSPADLESAESRERFLAGLPPWLFGSVGANTPCVTVQIESEKLPVQKKLSFPGKMIVFDAGSGMKELAAAIAKVKQVPSQYNVFFSHFHLDHIMGFPFFTPAYDPTVTMNFYSPMEVMKAAMQGQMDPPYFPVPIDYMASKKKFHTLSRPVKLFGASISYRKMNHPGDSYSYKVDDGKHKFIYATDTELSSDDFAQTDENTAFFSNADLIIIDSQYTLGEAIKKFNWGHSAFSFAVEFAANWNVKHIVLFHHDPGYSDQKLYNNLQSAKWYTERMNMKGIKISLAIEGMEICLQ